MLTYTVLSMGDPCGTSPEIIIKTVEALSSSPDATIVVVGDAGVFRRTAADLSMPLPFTYFADDEADLMQAERRREPFIFLSSSSMDLGSFAYGSLSAEAGDASYKALHAAVDIIQNGMGRSLVTCPVSGLSLEAAGYQERSVHGLLRTFASTDRLENMVFAGRMNIFGLTHRRSLRSAIAEVTRERIIEAIIKIDALRVSPYFEKGKPLAVCSLNPLFPDGSWTGPEEEEAIIPAVEVARKLGMDVVGPVSPEAVFSNGAKGEYAAILVMTSGEGFAACSAAAPDETLILSWGLPFLRIGLVGDAGFAEAGKDMACIKGMLKAVSEALRLRDTGFMV